MIAIDEAGRGRRMLRLVRPPASLAHLVEILWVEDPSAVDRSVDRAWRIVPDGSPVIVWQCTERNDGIRCDSSVAGARTVFVDRDRSGRLLAVGARLVPGAIPALFHVPAHELTDRTVNVHDLVRSGSDLYDASRPALDLFVGWLSELVRSSASLDPRVRAFSQAVESRRGDVRVADLARELGIAPRTVRAMLPEHVGLSPKRFARIRRLQHAAALAIGGSGLAEVALRAGYVDQAHLTRDFQALLGATPARYLARGAAFYKTGREGRA